LRKLLLQSGPGLVNVTGARGVGKSALVRSVLDEVGTEFADVRRLDLTGETAATALAGIRQQVAHLPIPLRRGRDDWSDGQLLLCLDRADALAHSGADLTRLLTHHSGVTVVAETLPPLRDPGIAVLVVEPLPTEAAVELLRRSAQAVGVRVGTDEASTAYLHRICRAVDGNPLAVELAAARLPSLPPPALAAALESPNRALVLLSHPSSDGRSTPAIRGLLEDAYRAASAPAQQLLALLSVFAGPFSIDAVESVSAGRLSSCFDPLSELLDVRLVELDPSSSTGRYRLSRLVRDFAAERLDDGPDRDAARARHADHFAAIARKAARAGDDADEDAARALLEQDYPEAIVALRSLRETDPTRALRLAADLGWETHRRGGGATVVEVLEELTSTPGQGDDAARRDALLWLVQLASWSPLVSDQAAQIGARLTEGMALARAVGEPRPLMRALRTQLSAVTAHGDVEAAMRACAEGIELAASIGHARWLGRFEISLAAMHGVLQQFEEAVRLASAGLARALRTGDRGGIALGALALHALPPEHVPDRATVPPLESVLDIFREQGDLRYEIHTLATLAQEAIDREDPRTAATWVLARMERLGQSDLLHGLTISVMLTVHIARLCGDHATAARLHGAVASHMPPLLALMAPGHVTLYQGGLVAMQERLGQSGFDSEVAAGRLLDRGETLLATVAFLREVVDGTGPPVEPTSTPDEVPLPLTPREQEVLDLLARGLRNKEIATSLCITPKTVMHHTVAIYRKLGVRSRTEAVAALARARPHAGSM
jgi:DNA-binding CsgD family transcriptional regulator/predicted ATPase